MSFFTALCSGVLLVALIASLMQLFCHVVVLLHVLLFGRTKEQRARLMALLVLFALTAYSFFFFENLFSHLQFDLFFTQPFTSALFDSEWPPMLVCDALILLLLRLFRIGCVTDSLKYVPSESQVENFQAKYESVKGHRDIVILIVLSGNEPFEQVLHCIASILDSKFPINRVRVLLSFPGNRICSLDRSLREELSSDAVLEEEFCPAEDVMVKGLKITFCRFKKEKRIDSENAMFQLVSDRYHLQQRKPLILFLDSSLMLDRLAISMFAYEMDNPNRLALTGLTSTAPTSVFGGWMGGGEQQVLHGISEDYAGNATLLPHQFVMIRFKVFKAASKHYFPSDSDADKNSFEVARTLRSDRFLPFLVGARRGRHRVGICIGARATVQPRSHSLLGVCTALPQRAHALLDMVANEMHRLVSYRTWTNVPLLNTIMLARIVEGHLWIWIELLLCEFLAGRGSGLGLIYILFLLLPTWLLVAAADYKLDNPFTLFSYPFQTLLRLFADPFAHVWATFYVLFGGLLTTKVHSERKAPEMAPPSGEQVV